MSFRCLQLKNCATFQWYLNEGDGTHAGEVGAGARRWALGVAVSVPPGSGTSSGRDGGGAGAASAVVPG